LERRNLNVDTDFAKRQAVSFLSAGGGEGLSILNKLYGGEEEQKKAVSERLREIAATQGAGARSKLIEDLFIRATGINVSDDEKQVLIRTIEELSAAGNKTGQMTLYNMEDVLKQAGIILGNAELTADNIRTAFFNFTNAKESMVNILSDSIQKMNDQERKINQALKMNALISQERSRIFQAYGKPFSAAAEEFAQTQKDIKASTVEKQRQLNVGMMQDFTKEIIPQLSTGGVKEFEKFLKEVENLSVSEKVNRLETLFSG
jgi:hypothetical protein